MAKRYIVDLRGLEPAERKAAYEQIDGFSFSTSQVIGEMGLEGAEVIWRVCEEISVKADLL